MVNVFGQEVPIGIDISGFISSSWIWVAIVLVFGLVAIIGIALLLFFKTYNRKVILFENIAGQGYQPILKTRARIIRLNKGGDEILKTLIGGYYLTASARKMGKRTYWFAKAQDGYWYNIILGDLDAKMGMLDIEPVDRDVRMMRISIDRLSLDNYGKKSKVPVILMGIGIFVALIILLGGMYVVAGQFVEASQTFAATSETNKEVLEALKDVLQGANNIQTGSSGGSGLVPAS